VNRIILLIFAFSGLWAHASHLAGGELTYTHISAKIYDINVTIYRDCNDCKLSGTGGGNSTKNCNDLDEVFIRTINGSCGNKKIGSIALTKIGFRNITQLCATSNSKCDNNSNYNYGFEAHHYRGRVNFENYSEYNGCLFQIFFHKSERSSNITNLNTEEDDLYNFALINPWVANISSPQFSEDPKILYNINQSVYLNDGVIGQTGDSLVFNWGIPFSNYNSAITYKSNFSPAKFLSTYCPAGNNCSANPDATIPEGLFLNQENGEFIFTPIGNNETSTRVLEVEQWRDINGTKTLVGKVRRDVLAITISENSNNSPTITVNDTYNICAGQKFNLNLDIKDIPIGNEKEDSVNISVVSNLNGLAINKVNKNNPPFENVNISYSSKIGDEGEYFIRIKATDNYCPEIANSYKTIKLIIRQNPQISINVNDPFCGNNYINLNSNQTGTFELTIKDSDGITLRQNTSYNGTQQFQYLNNEKLLYQVSFKDTFGCSANIDTVINNLGNSNIIKAEVSGDISVCENEKLKLKLSHSELSLNNIKWLKDSQIQGDSQELLTSPFDGLLFIEYALSKDNLTCPFSDSITIKTLKTTPITSTEISNYCYTEVFDLANLSVNPQGGIWKTNLPTTINVVSLNNIGNKDTFFDVNYIYTNADGCSSLFSKRINILESPVMKLANDAVCGDNFAYRLRNSIELPYNPFSENISWNILNKPEALNLNPYPNLDIPTYGTGIYVIEAINKYTNGCETRDTGIITVDKGLELTTNNIITICQQGEAINLESYLDINATQGGWNSFSAGDLLKTRMFTPSKCGTYDFLYTYDKNGCFDELNIELEVICRPEFNVELPGAICSNYETINLPNQGNWEGPGVSNNQFSPSGHSSWIYLRNIKKVNNCLFDTFIPIEIIKPLILEIGSLPSKLCEGEIITSSISATDYNQLETTSCGGSFSFLNSTFSYSPSLCDLDAGEINISLNQKSEALCYTIEKDIHIPYFPIPRAELNNASKECWPYSIDLPIKLSTNVSEINYSINSNTTKYQSSGRILKYEFPKSGNFNLEINTVSSNGCSNSQFFENQFILFPKPKASFLSGDKSEISLSERDIYFSNNSYISNGTLTYEWYWSKNNKTQLFSTFQNPYYTFPADTGKFNIALIANSEKGCSDTTFKDIWIVPDILVFIPNAFTPDGKGPPQNSRFNIVSKNVQSFHIQIFNKWGQMVFQSNDISNSWDGTFGDKICQTGVYVYSIKILNQSGLEYSYQGTVSLVR